jgi:hypothetical protein
MEFSFDRGCCQPSLADPAPGHARSKFMAFMNFSHALSPGIHGVEQALDDACMSTVNLGEGRR